MTARLASAVTLVLCLAAVSGAQNKPKNLRPAPDAPKFSTPIAAVNAYVAAVKKGDLFALSHVYTSPLDGICRATAKFQKAHDELLAAVHEKWGKKARAVVNKPPFNAKLRLFAIQKFEQNGIEKKEGVATVSGKLHVKSLKVPRQTVFNLRLVKDSWRVWGIDGKALGVPSDAHSYKLEWSIREEATRRALDRIADGGAKTPAEVVVAREEYVKIITQERLVQKKLNTPPKPRPGAGKGEK